MSSFFNTVKGNGDLAVKNSRTLRCDENQITSNVSLDLTIYTVLICGHLHLLNVLPVWVLRFSEMTIPCVAVHIKESNTRPPARLKLERLSPEPLHTLLRWIFLDPILLKSINHAKLLLMINEDCPRFSGVGFAEIVDFLRGSNLKYALTTNLTIHDSLVKQFWQTATAKTLADGTLELHATIDTIAYTITEASIRSKLKLADASGITMLLNNEIFEGMGHMGDFRGAPRPLLLAMLSIVAPVQGKKLHLSTQPNHASTAQGNQTDLWKGYPHFGVKSKDFGGCFKEKDQGVLLSDSEEEEIEAQGRKFHDLDPLVSLLQELVTPSKTVNASGEEQVEDISPTTLEVAAILTKVKKIKSVNKGNRYKRRKSSKESALVTGLDFEESYGLLLKEVNTGGLKVSAGIEEINAGSLDVNTGIDPVTTDSIRVSIPSPDRGKREGKAPMIEEEETQASRKTKEQILQEEVGLAEAIRLDALEKAMEKERIWPNIRLFGFNSSSKSKLEANAELKKSVLGNDLTVKDYAKRMVELLISIDEVGIFEDSKEDFGKIGLPTVPYELLKLTKERTQLQRKGLKKTKDDEPNQGRLERGEQIGKERIPLHTYDKDDI
ncbi:hypothetical protein Tco_1275903 [Tanacetum coccineum]